VKLIVFVGNPRSSYIRLLEKPHGSVFKYNIDILRPCNQAKQLDSLFHNFQNSSRLLSGNLLLVTESEIIFNQIRINVMNGVVSHEDVEIYFEHESGELWKLELDADGRMEVWPRGFFDTIGNQLQEIMNGYFSKVAVQED
jgi:predicted ATPase